MKKSILRKAIHYLWLHGWKYKAVERQHKRLEEQLKGRKQLNVVFMALDVALWRYQSIYELMVADERFNPTVVLTPCMVRDAESDLRGLRKFFDERNIPYIDYDSKKGPVDIRKELRPDIIFYTQPYEYLLIPEYDCRHFYDLLLCYMPYGFWSSTGKLSYNLHFHNMAWRLYYSTSLHLQEAQKVATNHGRNVRVVGYANTDDYLKGHYEQVWKTVADGVKRKRVIWAPHFSIIPANSAFPPRGNFLWLADMMLKFAKEYADRIQIAFKPHPALLNQLYQHPDWGKERADAYYEQWRTMENTQLETGQFVDLFMTSDAMIHDSGSFAVEYHYSRKPVMFVTHDKKSVYSTLSEFGYKAYDLHYFGQNEADVRHFIDDVVLGGNDPLRLQREQFYHDYLLPPGGKSVAQNVMDDIVESLALGK